MSWLRDTLDKYLGQTVIVSKEGTSSSSFEPYYSYTQYYENIETVNRAVNMVVDDVSEIRLKVGLPTKGMTVAKGTRAKTVDVLLNVEPNPYQDINTFRRNLVLDYLLDGNIFIYYDGVFMYQCIASKMVINTSTTDYIESYTYDGKITYKPEEIIHIKENSFKSVYRGTSRLRPALRSMKLLVQMRTFQDNFFKNGAIPGLVIKSPNTLSEKIKERMLAAWGARYRPDAGGRRPLILDGGMELEDISKMNFKDLDFEGSISNLEKTILTSIGVPPIMMDSGNNANIRPNHRMYYLETIMPIVKKMNYAFERYFGFEIREDISNIPALQPELQEQASFLTNLVNGGVLTPNEARADLGKERIEGHDDLRIPQNIAGSAVDSSQGGRPKEGKE